jgi:hypothetical protein
MCRTAAVLGREGVRSLLRLILYGSGIQQVGMGRIAVLCHTRDNVRPQGPVTGEASDPDDHLISPGDMGSRIMHSGDMRASETPRLFQREQRREPTRSSYSRSER